MVLSVTTAWKEAMSSSGAAPQFLVDIELGPAAYLTVHSYSSGSGDSVSLIVNGVSLDKTEGVDFTAATSNEVTAANIAAAFEGWSVGGIDGFVARRGAVLYFFTTDTTATTIEINSDDEAAWSPTPSSVPRTLSLCTGDDLREGYRNILGDLSPVSQQLDPFDRSFSIGDVELSIADDGTFREIAKRVHLKGKRVTVQFGTTDLDTGDFAPVGTYLIDDVVPTAGAILVRCVDQLSWLRDQKVSYTTFDTHPLTSLQDLLTISGIPSTAYNSSALDPTALTETSHLAVSRAHLADEVRDLEDPAYASSVVATAIGRGGEIDVLELIGELLVLLGGTFIAGEDGQYAFTAYDPDAAAVRALTDDDIDGLGFEQTSTLEHISTRIAITGAPPSSIEDADESARTHLYTTYDAIAEAAQAFGTAREYHRTIDSDWLGTPAYCRTFLDDTHDVFYAEYATLAGISGTRATNDAPSTTQASEDSLSIADGRLAYLLLTNGVRSEIVEAKLFEFINDGTEILSEFVGTPIAAPLPAPIDAVRERRGGSGVSTLRHIWRIGRFTLSDRGLFGTTAVDWAGEYGALRGSLAIPGAIRIYDVTAAKLVADRRLAREAAGCPIVRVRVPLHHWDLQVGDFVTVDSDLYLHFGKDGADSTTVFEITSKELLALDEGSPALTLTLAWVRDDVSITVTPSWEAPDALPVVFPLIPLVNDAGEILTTDDGRVVTQG